MVRGPFLTRDPSLQGIFCHPMGAGDCWSTGLSPPSEWGFMRPCPMGILRLQLSIQRLNFLLGHPQGLSSHVLCRGAANAVDCTVTLGDVGRDWSLLIQPRPTGYGSPEDPDYGTQGLMFLAVIICTKPLKWTPKVTTLAPLIGDLIKIVGLMGDGRDPRAPDKLMQRTSKIANWKIRNCPPLLSNGTA